MRILVLGGYGNTGTRLCALLTSHTDAEVIVAGRDIDRATRLAGELNMGSVERVSARALDASDREAIARACYDIDLLVVASSTGHHTGGVARAAIETGTDYMDVVFSSRKLEVLRSLEKAIRDSGRCFITDGGFHPGLPAAVGRALADEFDSVESLVVAGIVRSSWRGLNLSPTTMAEFAEELAGLATLEFREGSWRRAGIRDAFRTRDFDFGPPFGEEPCVPMFLGEMEALTREMPDLVECGFWIAGFGPVVDWLVTPTVILAMRASGGRLARPMGRLLAWGLGRFARPPFGTTLLARVEGVAGGHLTSRFARLSHEDMYDFTAIPAFACLLQYLDGTIRKPGLFFQGMAVEPVRFLGDLEKHGVKVSTSRILEPEPEPF